MKPNPAMIRFQKPTGEVCIFQSPEDLSRAAASLFVELANEAVRNHGTFRAALSGGSTPRELYSLLASPEFSTGIPWQAVHLFWGDERCVPPDDPESNYGMVREALLQRIPIPATNVHRIRGEVDPREAAEQYEALMRESFGASNKVPRFDLVLLGLGEDGHTASLFPGASALDETERLVVALYVEKLKAYRISLTLPVINQAAAVAFLVSGEGKRSVVFRVLGESGERAELPAQRVRPADGKLIWFLDIAAAAEISQGVHSSGPAKGDHSGE